MNNPITILPASSKHSCVVVQNKQPDAIEKAKCFNKKVESIEPTISFKLQINESEEFKAYDPNVKNRSILKYIPLKLAGEKFSYINGNFRDEPLSALISKECLKKEISFTLAKPDSTDREYTPEPIWQERFIKCIEEGMVSFIKEDYDTILPNTGGMKAFEYYGTSKLMPTCSQFARYLMLGTTSYSSQYKVEESQSADIYKHFSAVSLFDDSKSIHEFIHIAEGVCLSKIGSMAIYFHTTQDILKFYEKAYDKSLYLREIEYSDS